MSRVYFCDRCKAQLVGDPLKHTVTYQFVREPFDWTKPSKNAHTGDLCDGCFKIVDDYLRGAGLKL